MAKGSLKEPTKAEAKLLATIYCLADNGEIPFSEFEPIAKKYSESIELCQRQLDELFGRLKKQKATN